MKYAAMVCMLAAAVSTAAAAEQVSKWPKTADVVLEVAPDRGAVEFELTPEVFAVAQQDLAGLRIVDLAGAFVPRVTRWESARPRRETKALAASLYNPTYLPGRQSSVVADFGAKLNRNEIYIETVGVNFRRRVMVEACDDGKSWQVLRKAGWLFRVAAGAEYQKRRVSLPANDFRYLRVTVFNAPDDPERIEIRRVQARNVTYLTAKTAPVPLRSTEMAQKPRIKATEINIDTGIERLPLCELRLGFEDENFLRRVTVLGRDRLTRTIVEHMEDGGRRKKEIEEPWATIRGGTVHRFTASGDMDESLTIRLDSVGARCRYLKVRIFNGDNAPLRFTEASLRRTRAYVAFQPKTGGAYRLLAGNEGASRPAYDLLHFIGRLRKEGVTEARLGTLKANPDFSETRVQPPWSERHKWPLWCVLIGVGTLLAILIVRRGKHIGPVDEA